MALGDEEHPSVRYMSCDEDPLPATSYITAACEPSIETTSLAGCSRTQPKVISPDHLLGQGEQAPRSILRSRILSSDIRLRQSVMLRRPV